jgi:hypothetical protein
VVSTPKSPKKLGNQAYRSNNGVAIAVLDKFLDGTGRRFVQFVAPDEMVANLVLCLPGARNSVGVAFGAIDAVDRGSHSCRSERILYNAKVGNAVGLELEVLLAGGGKRIRGPDYANKVRSCSQFTTTLSESSCWEGVTKVESGTEKE